MENLVKLGLLVLKIGFKPYKFFAFLFELLMYAYSWCIDKVLYKMHIFSARLTLSPHRAFMYLTYFWLFGVACIYCLAKNDLLVLSLKESDMLLSSNVMIQDNSPKETSTIITPPQLEIQLPNQRDGINYPSDKFTCSSSINPWTYALDMVLPLFKLQDASQCSISKEANVAIRFFYVIYPILGAILSGLTLFSWAGILQNRLSK